jgi:hypothetical protein
MIGLPAGTRIWIAAGVTDLRRGFKGLSGMVQTALMGGGCMNDTEGDCPTEEIVYLEQGLAHVSRAGIEFTDNRYFKWPPH